MERNDTTNPYQSPEAVDDTTDDEPELHIALGEPLRVRGSLSLDDWHEAEWVISQRYRGVIRIVRPPSHFAAYTATALLAYTILSVLILWRSEMNPIVLGTVIGIGCVIAGTVLLFAASSWHLRRQHSNHKGPFRLVEFLFTDHSMTVAADGEKSEVAWSRFDFYRRNGKILLLHPREATSSLIVARSLFESPADWNRLCEAIDKAFDSVPQQAR